MEDDPDKVDKMVLALLWLTSAGKQRAWKSHDWDALERLHSKGYISDPRSKAKSVVFLCMSGGPSHMETFDPKPLLNKLDGQKRPASFGEAKYQFVSTDAKLLGTKRTFKRYGKSGIEVSDLLPHTAGLSRARDCEGRPKKAGAGRRQGGRRPRVARKAIQVRRRRL